MSRTRAVGLVALAVSMVWTAIGSFAGPEDEKLHEFLIPLVIEILVTGLVFLVVFPSVLTAPRRFWTALVLSVLGFLFVAVYWIGVSTILGVAGALLGYESLGRAAQGSQRVIAWLAVAIGVLAVLGHAAIVIGDAV